MSKEYVYEDVRVLRVLDGDTIEFEISMDIGFKVKASTIQKFRILGIDTHETTRRYRKKVKVSAAEVAMGKKAKKFAANMFTFYKVLRITTHKTDVYGRYLASLQIYKYDGSLKWFNYDTIMKNEGFDRNLNPL